MRRSVARAGRTATDVGHEVPPSLIENIGVQPDFEVEITPKDWMANRDPQLEKAVQVAMEELKKFQPMVPKKPKYPVHK